MPQRIHSTGDRERVKVGGDIRRATGFSAPERRH